MSSHPRLFFDADERASLHALRTSGHHALIWNNLVHDARRHAMREPATDWIPPQHPDPVYENLYDRFWAMLGDAAILEQLAFATSIGMEDDLRTAAVRRLIACCTRWSREAEVTPDYGSAYATTRVIKAIAVSYDLLFDVLSPSDRRQVRDLIARATARLASGWFMRSDVAGPVGLAADRHSPHHSSVEWSAFGLAALSVLDEIPDARGWVQMTERHLRTNLLGRAFTSDGAQPEGTAYWSSTVFSQLQVTDALRRSTGVDLVGELARSVDLRMACAMYRPYRQCLLDGEPWYGENTALSAVLFALAGELGDSRIQRLATLEQTTGRLDVWPARTPRRGEQMSFATGGYAYVWCRPDLVPGPEPALTPWRFPSVEETYLRTGWAFDDLHLVLRSGRLTVYTEGDVVFEDLTPARRIDVEASRTAGTGIEFYEPAELVAVVDEAAAAGDRMSVHARAADGRRVLTVDLDRRRRRIDVHRWDGARRTWAFASGGRLGLELARGRIHAMSAEGHRPDLRAGYGLLEVVETERRRYPTMTVDPDEDQIQLTLAALPGENAR